MDDLLFSYADETTPRVKRKLIHMVELLSGQPKLKSLYFENRRNPQASESFWAAAIRKLALDVRYDKSALANIPKSGPLVVIANHPFGVLDGLMISWLMEKARQDFIVLTNAVLLRIPETQAYLLPVDFGGTPEAMETNLKTRAAARTHLQRGGAVVVFPAGGISTAPDRLGRKPATDAPWQLFTAQLIQRSKATVVPLFFGGQNSRLFQIASHISLTLRLSLIFHEVKKRIGTILPVAVGAPIAFDEIAHLTERQALVDELRARTYRLKEKLLTLKSVP